MPDKAARKAEKYICCQCGNDLPLANFIKSSSSIFAGLGHLPICKSCIVREFKKYKIEYQSAQRAMQRLCMMFDIYFDAALFDKCPDDDNTVVGSYIRRTNLGQYKGRTFDTTIEEGFYFTGEKSRIDMAPPNKEKELAPIDPRLTEKWGEGLAKMDYSMLEDHYRYLKSANPNCDSNQEIFIIDLCFTKMQQMRAVRESRVDDYSKLTESYRKTFAQAGLKTVQDAGANNEDCWGVWQERIAQYTPEEYYRNKKLYRDFDGIGSYFERFVLRPLRNLMHGTQERDSEYCVLDDGDDHDDEFSDSE